MHVRSTIKPWKAIATVVALAAALTLVAASSGAGAQGDGAPPAEPSKETPNCVTEAVSAEELGKVEPDVRCYASYADVLRSMGYEDVPDDAQPGDEASARDESAASSARS